MQNHPELYVPFIYFLAAVTYAWLGLLAWRKRPTVAVTPFAWTMLGMAIWSFIYGLEIFAPTLELKLFFTKIEYIGIVSIPVLLLIFSLEFIGKNHLLGPRGRMFLWLTPLLIVVLTWTNQYHHLMWGGESLVGGGGLVLLNIRYGVFFWIQVIYSYMLVLVASLLLIAEMVQRPGVYRVEVSLIVIGILAPWIGSLIFIARVNPVHDLDFTPLFFLPTGLGLSWAISRYRLLEILPLEHLTVLKNMTDGVIVINHNKRVLYVNPLIEELLACSETDVLGQPLNYISRAYGDMLASSRDRSEITIGIGDLARIFEVNTSQVTPEGLLKEQDGPDRMIVLHDITERKKAENALSRRETMMSAISLAAEQFLKESTWEHNIPGILEKIGQAIDISRVYIFMNYTDENGAIHSSQRYEWSAPGIKPQIDNPGLQQVNLQESGFGRWEERLSSGRPVYGLTREFPDPERIFLQDQDILSIAIIPIFVNNQWWGFIGFDECTYERYWTNTELEALHITASVFGSAETRAQTEHSLIRRQQALTLLQDIVSEALQAKTLKDMAEDSASRLARLINSNDCSITLWNEDHMQTSLLAAYGMNKDARLSTQPVLDGYTFPDLALHLGKTLIVDDVLNSPYVTQAAAEKCTVRSLIVLPMTAAKNKLGAIILSFMDCHRFQPEEISICEQAAGLVALAIEKFQALEQAQQRATASETLRKAGVAVTETLETDETVSRILEQLQQVIPYNSASVQLLHDGELEIIGGSGFSDPKAVIGIRFPIPGNNPNTIVIQTGKPYLLPEIIDIYPEFKAQPHDHIHSWLGVPLIFQDRIIGLLTIDSATPNQFTQDNISLAMAFADQVSGALENARIFKATQDQAITDPLTGIYNRRGLFQIGEFEFLRARRINRPFSALLFDIDHFKEVNDRHGHTIGDQVLCELADRCRTGSRAVDLVCRYGGEEFIVLLPETNLESARSVAERLRQKIMKDPFESDAGTLEITISIGVAESNEYDTLQTLIERADIALYEAKRGGRNQVKATDAHQVPDQT
ncbi:MAG: diguanylate cyclase [Chloroflexi bacterium]|nr:diguanylate cyclase [Chloroflexota bacterium]